MATYTLHQRNYDHALLWTLAISIGLHILALLLLPNIHIEKEPPEPTLTIELAPLKKAEPAPQPVESPKPEVKPEPTPIPKPITKTEPIIQSKTTPSPLAEPAPVNPPPTAEPPTTPVISATPKTESQQTVQVPVTAPPPPPEPVKVTGPSQQDIDAAKNQYGNLLAREIAKYKQYPKIAQMRGWQGEVILELQLDSNGKVISSKIHESSTFEALDKQALEMVKKATFPAPPDALRGHSFNILVPVSFKLE